MEIQLTSWEEKKQKDLFSPPVCELLHPWSEHDFPANWLSVGVV
jgi:hypothetical protein